jgi:ribosomal protein L44E
MIWDELKGVIRDTCENDCFKYTDYSVTKIRKGSDCWNKEWVTIFKRILARIKKGFGGQDGTNNKGKVVALPLLDNKNCMVVFFTSLSEKHFLIYDFKIVKK